MTTRAKRMIALVFGLAMTMTILGAGFAYAASDDVAPAAGTDEAADTQIRERAGEVVRDGFEALTDEQKAEIYALTDEQETLRDKVLDKLVEFGVLDQDEADELKARHAERYAEMKENGSLFGGPKGRGAGGRCGMGGRGGMGGGRGFANGECPMAEAAEGAPEIEATDFN